MRVREACLFINLGDSLRVVGGCLNSFFAIIVHDLPERDFVRKYLDLL